MVISHRVIRIISAGLLGLLVGCSSGTVEQTDQGMTGPSSNTDMGVSPDAASMAMPIDASIPAIDANTVMTTLMNMTPDAMVTPDAAAPSTPDMGMLMPDEGVPINNGLLLDNLIRTMGRLDADPPSKTEMDPGEAFEEGDYRCTTRRVTETQRHEQMVAYQTNSESLWPGALVRGSAVADGLLTQVVLPRQPMGFSVSLQNLAGENSGRMQAPSLSQYRDELQRILAAGVNGATPAFIFSEIKEVHSEEQLQINLGVDVSGLTGMVSSSFDFRNENKRSRFMVNFVQAYYTVDADPPVSPSGFFAPEVMPGQLFEAFGRDEGGAPLYVSSITYGRRVIFTAESSVSMRELRAALEFAYNGGVIDVDGSVSLTHREVLETTSMTAFILGGAGDQAVRAINGLDDLREFIQTGGNYSQDSPGAPIAYKLLHLADNSAARMSYTTDYDVKECERVSQRLLVTLDSIRTSDGGNSVRIYGDVFARALDRTGMSNRIDLFSVAKGSAFPLDEGDVWPDGAEQGPSGILNVSPQAGQQLELRVRLRDKDLLNDDRANANVDLPFEGGWRHECDGPRTGGYVANTDGRRARFSVRFCIRPIP